MSKKPQTQSPCISLPTYDGELVNAIIETPMSSHAKYSYDHKTCLFKLSMILPAGMVFPYNFGYLPSTKAEDGDPIDVLVMMDAAAHPGCLIPARLIGVIEGEQTEKDGTTERNDRLLAVAANCPTYGEVKQIDQLCQQLVEQVEYFFIAYNKIRGKKFKPLGRHGARRAEKLIKTAMERFEKPSDEE